MTVKLDKNEYRQKVKKNLLLISKDRARCNHYKMLPVIERLLYFFNAKDVLLYMPMVTEPNVLKICYKLNNRINFYTTFMLNKSLKMVKLRMPFKKVQFGLLQPNDSNEHRKNIQVAIVPVIGVDRNMARIGHGKGYYDMFFANLPFNPIVIFVGIKDYFLDGFITQKHDVRSDFYITPTKNYLLRGKYDRSFDRIRSRCGGSWRRVSNIKKD